MPTARETLLEAAHTALSAQPWPQVRMVDVAALAGVSRQTLYNEFGSKEGLGTALVERLVAGFLDGAVRAAAEAARSAADPAASCAAAAAWMLRTARDEPIVHAALTGCWGSRMPFVTPGARASGGGAGDERAPDPGELAAALCEQMVTRLAAGTASGARTGTSGSGDPHPLPPVAASASQGLTRACEAGLRVALSYVVAPPAAEEKAMDEEVCVRIGEVVRALLPG